MGNQRGRRCSLQPRFSKDAFDIQLLRQKPLDLRSIAKRWKPNGQQIGFEIAKLKIDRRKLMPSFFARIGRHQSKLGTQHVVCFVEFDLTKRCDVATQNIRIPCGSRMPKGAIYFGMKEPSPDLLFQLLERPVIQFSVFWFANQ